MPVQNNAADQFPRSSRDNQKIELHFEPGEGNERITLKYSTWVDGLGWCCQKTIRLDSDQLDELQRAITVARHRIRRRRADAGRDVAPAQVIQLPTIA